METEILKNWLEKSEKFFNAKYEKIMKHEGAKTGQEMIEYDDAITIFDFLKLWRKRLTKILNGKTMPDRILNKIEHLPNPETTSPRLFTR